MQYIKYIIPLILPFLIMVVVNEYSRPSLQGYHNSKYDVSGMNPNKPNPHKCTWTGFFDTGYCKRNHVKYLNNYYTWIDPIYFGMINALHNTGNYAAGNLFFLVFLWPAIMYFLLVRIMQLKQKLKNG